MSLSSAAVAHAAAFPPAALLPPPVLVHRSVVIVAAGGRDLSWPQERIASALLSIKKIFGSDLPADPRFTTAVTAALDSLIRHGSQQSYENFRSTHP
jgi:hypothetical protein